MSGRSYKTFMRLQDCRRTQASLYQRDRWYFMQALHPTAMCESTFRISIAQTKATARGEALRTRFVRFADARRKIMAFAAVSFGAHYGGSGCAVRCAAPPGQLRTSSDVSLCSPRAQRSSISPARQANWFPALLGKVSRDQNAKRIRKRKRVSEDAY